ncbi:aldose 1-epimerase [Rubrivivax benzoatilyticus]|uniref:Aldose 1-epimerase n=1 Tax=Rubrivivax benzoatilyticus TaxID=316997 RepID=A0ABX0HZE1_9BURK|nr:aldose 1-epimerase [Rubrivivax benzoatilyticus]EGJ10854.1 aldose 1-epimerase [Rubrivivax benzoatilyticus JA2 = ATCC BAA-35]NHK98908.1 aldose 1-epimerase [Rubrivivax benzoatilyticus]NHL24410.1 aldose 1-epimerase [Rubrivivax benzoatilyticus]
MTPSALELRAGELRLALRPDLGGAIAGLWLGELPVLRSTEPAELASSRLAACYPLAPYSNRLGYRRLRWHGHDHTTAPNEAGSPHSLHGIAWQRGWEVLEADAASATLGLVHPGDSHWPFAFEVRQRFVLEPDALKVSLELRNTGAEPQPVGLGWHPYFPKRARSRLHAEVAQRWDSDPSGLPTRAVPQPGIDADVAHLSFDHCFDGWRGPARIRDEKLSLRLTSSMSRLVVYTPPTKPYFCVEPVSHVSNAVHMADPLAHGLVDVAPGAGTEAWMRLDIAPV